MAGEMRIALVSGSWPPIKCGVGDFTHRLAVELARQGEQVSTITDQLARDGGSPGIDLQPVVRHWGPSALPSLLSAINQSAPDVVNLHYPTLHYSRLSLIDLLPTAVRCFLKTPVVTTIHEYTTFRSLGRARVEWLARTSTALIVPDQANRRQLQAALPGRAERIHYIPLGPAIDVQLPGDFSREAWRRAHAIPPDVLVIVFFGFISPSKGVETLLPAFAQLPESVNARLYLVADREPSAPQYADYHHLVAEEFNTLAQRYPVEWTGYLPSQSVSTYLAAADLAVLPFVDGASMRRTTLLAAIAHGLPVLSTGDRPPCPGVHVVPAGNAAALAQAIVHLGTDAQALACLRQQAEKAAKDLSWPAIARETASCLKQYVRPAEEAHRREP
jgi:polysaccharide biosynthesis protein PslF